MAVPDFESYLAAQLQWLTQAVAREFRGVGQREDGRVPRRILSCIILHQPLRLETLPT